MKRMILVMLAIMLVLSACVSSKTYKAQQARVQMMEARQNEQDANLEMARKDVIGNKEKIEQLIIGMNNVNEQLLVLDPMQDDIAHSKTRIDKLIVGLDSVNEQLLVLDPMQDEIINSANAIIDLQGDMTASGTAIGGLQTQVAALNRQLDDAIAANVELEQMLSELSLDTFDTFDSLSDYVTQMKRDQSGFVTRDELKEVVEESAELAQLLNELTLEVEAITDYLLQQEAVLANLDEILKDQEDFKDEVIDEFEDIRGLIVEQLGEGAKSSAQQQQEIMTEISRIRGELDDSQDEISSLRQVLGQEVSQLRYSEETMREDMEEISDRVFDVNRGLTELATDLKDVIAKERSLAEKRRLETMTKQYKVALAEYNKHNYENSIILFEEFLENYPDSNLCANALYWIGENYYAAKNYAKALRQFRQVVTQYSDHPKAWDAQLKVGITYYQMHDYESSYSELMLIKNYYPDYPSMKIVDRYLNKI